VLFNFKLKCNFTENTYPHHFEAFSLSLSHTSFTRHV